MGYAGSNGRLSAEKIKVKNYAKKVSPRPFILKFEDFSQMSAAAAAAAVVPDHVCYVHCNFCNTILVNCEVQRKSTQLGFQNNRLLGTHGRIPCALRALTRWTRSTTVPGTVIS
ncbi:hypothetical protein KSP39_PZI010101 [Platanthera zijinensis]|uniref:YABBY N-terminal domain-containing protein n=1 Tax=Platanthera zijinensis TaxID=2320716 RepID=A0AAP0G699_9ASPA